MKTLRVISAYLKFFVNKFIYLSSLSGSWNCLMFWNSKLTIESKGMLELGSKVVLSNFAEVLAIGSLKIGSNVFVNKYSRIIAHESIIIGDNVLIAQFVTVLDHDHNRNFDINKNMIFENYNTSPIVIGNNVLIGDKVSILKGSQIGDNVVIGANCVISGSITSNCMVVFNRDSQIILPYRKLDGEI
ncbi:MAG: acyltransferase [Saprospiraceae bacterium]